MHITITIDIDETAYNDAFDKGSIYDDPITDDEKEELLKELLNHGTDWPTEENEGNKIDVVIDGEHIPFSFLDLQSA